MVVCQLWSIIHFYLRLMMKSVPLSISLSMSTEPPCALMISLQMLRPRPTPDLLTSYVSLTLPKFWNNLFWFSGEIPTPVSLKIISKWTIFRSALEFDFWAGFEIRSFASSKSGRISLSGTEFAEIELLREDLSWSPLFSLLLLLLLWLRSLTCLILSRTVTWPPLGVNLMLFDKKLSMN